MKNQKDFFPSEIAVALFEQLRRSGINDLNPYRRGFKNELISLLGSFFPRAARLSLQALPLDGNGWLSGDALYQLADISERDGSGLIELQPPENQALLLGLNPSDGNQLWRGFLATLNQKNNKRLNTCSLWGPCLGERADYLQLMEDLALELKEEIVQDFIVSICACPRDCRNGTERSDLSIIVEHDSLEFSLWLGGHHRPFQKLVCPRPWRKFSTERPHEMTSFVLHIHERFQEYHRFNETFPEMAERLQEEEFHTLFRFQKPTN
jgi:dissimilatory sulfite reductase (desulfoviridin) alpha/beta subunit